MVNLRSIKAKSILYTLLIMLVPVILLGALGVLYFHGVIKQNVQNDYLEEARTVGALTSNFLDRSLLALEVQSGRSGLINALDRRDIAALDDQAEKINDATSLYYWVYVTDAAGRVLSSSPYGSLVGKDLNDSPYVAEPLRTGRSSMGPATVDGTTGRLTRFVGTPIRRDDATIGVLVGALDDDQLTGILQSARSLVPLQSIYIVNRSGLVTFSYDKRDVVNGLNLSSKPAVQKVLNGEEGIDDRADLAAQGSSMAAYAPVPGYALGVLIAIPTGAIDRPINDATVMIALAILLLAALATGLALVIGSYLTNPIHRIATAAQEYRPGMDLSHYLPYDREDELGHLARAFRDMSDRITKAREKILGEKTRSDLYVDVMGHDINNLNQVVLSNLDLAQQTGSLNDRQREFVEGAKRAVGDSAAIIADVRAIQAATAGPPELKIVDLNDVIAECIKEAEGPKRGPISIRYTPRKGMVVNAVRDIDRAVCNVIEEALRNAHTAVDIAAGEATADGKRTYVVSVADDGPGIRDDAKQTLFTRFQDDSPVPPGKDLGLYVAKVLAEAFGGSISVEDRMPGDHTKGTRVVITLPAAPSGEGS
ncbi:MAG TPA: sensor histidine kinase [Methanocella sp.]|nr:sensor histidine kinase [Methanocella sp.]